MNYCYSDFEAEYAWAMASSLLDKQKGKYTISTRPRLDSTHSICWYQLFYLSIYPTNYLSTYLQYVPTYLPTYQPTYLSSNLPIYLSSNLPIYLLRCALYNFRFRRQGPIKLHQRAPENKQRPTWWVREREYIDRSLWDSVHVYVPQLNPLSCPPPPLPHLIPSSRQ